MGHVACVVGLCSIGTCEGMHVQLRVRVCLCFFVVWCRVMSCVARRRWLGGWVWCDAVDMSFSWWSLSLCRGPSHCVVIEK